MHLRQHDERNPCPLRTARCRSSGQRPADSAGDSRRTAPRARYALLAAEAHDRTETTPDNDSLLKVAWSYYGERPQELYGQCKTLYYRGREHLRRGDKPGALRLFLEVEERLRSIDEPYYTGLLYLRIGEVYRSELNFVRAYRYFRDARDLFMRSEHPRETTEALLGMTASALRMRDLQRARRDCTMALELADDLGDDTLRRRSLAFFATLHIFSEGDPIATDLLRRIERSVRRDTTPEGFCTLAQTQLLRGRPDSALLYLQLAKEKAPTARSFRCWPTPPSARRRPPAATPRPHGKSTASSTSTTRSRAPRCRLRPG